jgi:hypothetical protein
MNCTSYTFTVIIDKNLPGEIYTAIQLYISTMIAVAYPYFVFGLGYCGRVCDTIGNFMTATVLPNANKLVTDYVFPYADIIGYVVVAILLSSLIRCCFCRRSNQPVIIAFVEMPASDEKTLNNGQSLEDSESDDSDSSSDEEKSDSDDDSEPEQECDCVSCGGDRKCCEKEVPVNESDSPCKCDLCEGKVKEEYEYDYTDSEEEEEDEQDDERKDPTYRVSDSDSDYSDSEDEYEEELIAKALAGGREGTISEHNGRTARRNGRFVKMPVEKKPVEKKPVEKKNTKQNPVKTAPSNNNNGWILNMATGRWVKRTTALGKKLAKAENNDDDLIDDTPSPKKQLKGYMLFAAETRHKIVEENPGISFGGIGKLMGQRWRELDNSKKAMYNNGMTQLQLEDE